MALLAPKWDRSCAACERYVYDSDGNLYRDGDGKPQERKGLPTPCGSCAKVPTWAKAAGLGDAELRRLAHDMTPQNRRAFEMYRRWRAVYRFPDDPIVSWCAGIVRGVEEERDAITADRTRQSVVSIVTALALKGATGGR